MNKFGMKMKRLYNIILESLFEKAIVKERTEMQFLASIELLKTTFTRHLMQSKNLFYIRYMEKM